MLRLKGKDGLDFLHRISTNDVISLRVGAHAGTILTNEKGRMIDVVSVIRESDDSILVVGQSTPLSELRTWIEKFIVMEDLNITEVHDECSHIIIYDLESKSEKPDDKALKQWTQLILQAYPTLRLFTEQWTPVPTIHLLVPTSGSEFSPASFGDRFRNSSLVEYENFRIESGIPAHPNEINPSYNPLEAGLDELVSFTKGCYIGQEVIARLRTYEKVRRKLVQFEISGAEIHAPAPIISSGTEVGQLTSVTNAADKCHHALGYLDIARISDKDLVCRAGSGDVPITIKLQ